MFNNYFYNETFKRSVSIFGTLFNNITIKKVPTNIIAGLRGFDGMALYKSDAGSENAPDVEFDFE